MRKQFKPRIPKEFPACAKLRAALDEHEADMASITDLLSSADADERQAKGLQLRKDFDVDRDFALVNSTQEKSRMKRYRVENVLRPQIEKRNAANVGLFGARGEIHDAVLRLTDEVLQEIRAHAGIFAKADPDAAAEYLVMQNPVGIGLFLLERDCRGREHFPEDGYTALRQLEEFLAILIEWENRLTVSAPVARILPDHPIDPDATNPAVAATVN